MSCGNPVDEEISGQGLYDGLKDEVQVFGNVFRRTTAGRDNGSTWGVPLMYFGQKVEGGLFGLGFDEELGSGG